ncbi:FAD:protein FMN transferase [Mycolicibacterium sp. P9-64]|uniref:FAD:protein FMN transferase n=1 Tax=Mycolicibacterium sp. P9-64 TaxID=2024612 RepID=UPI001F5BA114|nr:FAD:protein FMN transferase [Mycolicibacterium sp. P9-64]
MTVKSLDVAQSHWQRWSTDMHLVVTDPGSLDIARQVVDAELDDVDAVASRFRPDSEVNSLATSFGRPTEVSELLAELLEAALTAAAQTDGDVDPTVGAALVALGYDGDLSTLGRDRPLVATVVTPAIWSMVTLVDRVATVPAGIQLDLGATAKAVAADRCAQRVYEVTGSGVLINLGGDIATAGSAPEGAWQVVVHDGPDDPASSMGLPPGAALATSSTLRRRWSRHGEPWHHILDPRTGLSADPVWRTVTVAAQTCYAANTVSTAAVVRGWTALQWIRTLGMTARLVDRDRVVHTVGDWPRGAHGALQCSTKRCSTKRCSTKQ